MNYPNLCSADGWFAEYDDASVRRIACFVTEGGTSIEPYAVADDGVLRPARLLGKFVGMWYIHDEH